jgi:hypothetical protein
MALIATLDPQVIDRVFSAPEESREALTPEDFEGDDGDEEAASVVVPAATTSVMTAGKTSGVSATAATQTTQSVVDMFLSGNNK